MRLSLYAAEVPVVGRYTTAAREVMGIGPGAVMAYHPVARMNPFQSLLYAAAFSSGFAPVGARRVGDLRALTAVKAMGANALVHLHWTSNVIGKAETEENAEMRVDEFLSTIADLKAADVLLLWTVHNRLPHDCRFPTPEIRLRRSIVEAADAIHVMESDTADQVADVFDLPEAKTFLTPHPSYVGAYPSHFDRALSRMELGLSQSDFVAGMIGSIQPYKGFDAFLGAVTDLGPSFPYLRGLIAGIPGSDPDSVALVHRLEAAETVKSLPRKLEDRDMSRLLSSLDVMVLPYRASLNSGAALLALSFGVPIVAPRIGAFRRLIEAGFGIGYDPSDPVGLRSAIELAPRFLEQVDRAAMEAHVDSLRAGAVSSQFFERLRDVLGW